MAATFARAKSIPAIAPLKPSPGGSKTFESSTRQSTKLKPPTPETGIQKYSSSLLIFVLFIIVVGLFMKKR